MVGITATEQNIEKRNEDNLIDHGDIKCINTDIIGVPEGKERNMSRNILIKLTKIKDKLFKATREKQQITYKGIPIRLSVDFSAEILQAKRECHDVFKVMKGKNLQPRIVYLVRFSFRLDREIKSFTEKQNLSVSPKQLYNKY